MRDQAIDWLLRSRAPTFAHRERVKLDAWLQENPLHRMAYHRLCDQWQWLDHFEKSSFPAREAALAYREPRPRPAWRYAFAMALVICTSWLTFSSEGWLGFPSTYATAKGLRQTVVLADGSRAELNTESEITVRYNHFGRFVELLRGEVFFSVRHNAARRFEVSAGNATIADLGTAFNVYKRPERIEVLVQEGRVSITRAAATIELAAGQQIAYRENGDFLPVSAADIASRTAWRKGLLLFRGRRLDEVLKEIGRYHETVIRLPNPDVAKLRVTGAFHTDKLDDLLNAVATLLPVEVKRVGPAEIRLEAK